MQNLATKALPKSGRRSPARSVKLAPEGIVTAIVAVTGVVDEVDDLIVPGAFTETLRRRRPKVVWHHALNDPVGRVLHIEEWLPGDPRLPKKTKDGKPWPKEAGALVATMQFNLASQRGREVFEHVRFYFESGEAEFSIGYKVPPGKSARRRDGVRVILAIDLYELSPVLFGAAPLSMALDVKAADLADGDEEDPEEAELHAAGLADVAWDEVEVEDAAAHVPPEYDADTGMEVKREFTAEQRRRMAERGTALPDGSFPISNEEDLRNAIRAVGRAKDKAKARRHIKKRARALGLEHLIPDSWRSEGMERKVSAAAVVLEAKAAEPRKGVMVALFPPPEVAKKIAHPGGSPAEDLHVTLAYLGEAKDLGVEPEELVEVIRAATEGAGPLSGQIGGIGRFPDTGEGTPTWAPVDVPGLAELRTRILDALADSPVGDKIRRDHGFTPHLTLGYDLDDVGDIEPTPVQFGEVYLVVGDDRYPIPLGPRTPVMAGMEVKTARQAVLEAKAGGWDRNKGNAENLRRWYTHGGGALRIAWGVPDDFYRCVSIASKYMTTKQAKGYCALRHREVLGVWPGQEHKSMKMQGSFEERRRKLEAAATELLCKGDAAGEAFVCVEATYPDRVVVTKHKSGGDQQSYVIPYTLGPGGKPKLGTPEKVDLTVVAVPDDSSDPADMEEVDPETAARVRYLTPIADMLGTVTRMVRASRIEGKAFDAALSPALDELIDAFDQKAAPSGDDDDEDVAEEDDPDMYERANIDVPNEDDELPDDDEPAADAAPPAEQDTLSFDTANSWSDIVDEEPADSEDAEPSASPPADVDEEETPEDEDDEEEGMEDKTLLDPAELRAVLDELST